MSCVENWLNACPLFKRAMLDPTAPHHRCFACVRPTRLYTVIHTYNHTHIPIRTFSMYNETGESVFVTRYASHTYRMSTP